LSPERNFHNDSYGIRVISLLFLTNQQHPSRNYIASLNMGQALSLPLFDDGGAGFTPSPPDDSEDDEDALRMLTIVFDGQSDSSDSEGRRRRKKRKRRRKRRGVMHLTSPEGVRVEMTPFMATWYNIYVAHPDRHTLTQPSAVRPGRFTISLTKTN
jgi:hypothetical protein